LRRGEQNDPKYRQLAPQGLTPALEAPQGPITQSVAILEWLEETVPTPPLLPVAPYDRAMVRGMAALIACDVHPLNNLRVLNALRESLGADDAAVRAWAGRWIAEGFAALEALTARHGGGFCFGDTPGLADCLLIPQIYSAQRFGVDLLAYPHLMAIAEHARTLPAFIGTHPDNQADADR
jgi:maleylpyruvate isomerase